MASSLRRAVDILVFWKDIPGVLMRGSSADKRSCGSLETAGREAHKSGELVI